MTSFAVLFCSTAIHPLARMASHQLKNYMDILSKIYILPVHCRSFLQEWQQKSQEIEEQAKLTLQSSETFYNTHAHPLPDIQIGSNMAIQNPKSKLWDIYGIITDINPHCRYYVKTSSGRVLVRNHRFLRRRIPLSIPTSHQQSNPAATPHQDPPTLRHSNHMKRPANRLIKDPNWHKLTIIVAFVYTPIFFIN